MIDCRLIEVRDYRKVNNYSIREKLQEKVIKKYAC